MTTKQMQTVEVTVSWETSLLQVFHIDNNQTFVLSSTKIKNNNHFVVDSEILDDLDQVPVVINSGDEVKFLALKNSTLEINGVASTINEVVMDDSSSYKLNVANLTITAKQVAKAKKIPYTVKVDKSLLGSSIASAVAAIFLLLTMFLVPDNNSLLQQVNEEDRLSDLRAFIQRQQERQVEQPQQETTNSQQGAAATPRHSGPDGQMGNRQAPARSTRHAIRNNGETPHLSRQAARDMVANRGIFVALGASGALVGGSSGIVSPFGGLTESGLENQNANGNAAGDTIGDSFGYGGLGTTGTGSGANGTGEGVIGVGNLNTNGIGGTGTHGYGTNRGSRLGARGTRGPTVRPTAPTVIGLLSPESIRRVVIRNLPQVIHCHEQGLVQNPALEGRVVVRFVIGAEGTVMATGITESNLAVPSVGQCISSAVRRWQFPAPEGGGIVTVNYPFTLQRPE
jgi:TonB family protein